MSLKHALLRSWRYWCGSGALESAQQCDKLQDQSVPLPAAGWPDSPLLSISSTQRRGTGLRQSLLFQQELVHTPQAWEKCGSDSDSLGILAPIPQDRLEPKSCSAQLSPEAEDGGAAGKAGTKLSGARRSHLNLTGFSSAQAPGCSGSQRMWFSKGGDVYAFTKLHPPFPF